MRNVAGKHGTYGGGLMQWTPWSKHVTWATANGFGNDPWSWEANLAHLAAELSGGGSWWRVRDASPSLASQGFTAYSSIDELKASKSVESAAVNFERAYEGSGDWNGRNSEGVKYADWQIYDNCRIQYGILCYRLLCGSYTGSTLSLNGNSNGSYLNSDNSGTSSGYWDAVKDSSDAAFVSGQAIEKYLKDKGLWAYDEELNDSDHLDALKKVGSNYYNKVLKDMGVDKDTPKSTAEITPSTDTQTEPSSSTTYQITTPEEENTIYPENTSTQPTYVEPSKSEEVSIENKGNVTNITYNNTQQVVNTNLDQIINHFNDINIIQDEFYDVLNGILKLTEGNELFVH